MILFIARYNSFFLFYLQYWYCNSSTCPKAAQDVVHAFTDMLQTKHPNIIHAEEGNHLDAQHIPIKRIISHLPHLFESDSAE